MRKTLSDVACYLKEIMPEIEDNPGDFGNNPCREDVLAFRTFLCRLYDGLIAEGDAYDNAKKVAHAYENRISLSVYYPFLHHVKTLLMNIGYRGTPADDGQSLLCGNDIFDEKLSTAKTVTCLRFLMDCGLCFGGIDTNDKKLKPSDIQALTVTYPDDPAMPAGLTVMAAAEREHGTLTCQDIFMRCDYRVLQKDAPNVLSIVRDTIRPLSPGVRDFVLQLHRRYLDQGLTCAVEIKGFHIYIKYCYRRKDVWGINASLNNGYHINVKAEKAEAYGNAIETFSPGLQQIIAKGYGCGRKRPSIGHCDGGCRGLLLPLNEAVLDMQPDIVAWLDREVLERGRR